MKSEPIHSICVFAGSADRLDQSYLDGAAKLGRHLAQSQIRIIYGGGKTDLMGALADSALAEGGTVIGVVPRSLFQPQLIHDHLTELKIVDSMHQRKALMTQMADAFIALPGGFGTLDELFETLTWIQIGIHRKPLGLLNINSYFLPLLAMVNHAQQEGFIYTNHRDLFAIEDDSQRLLKRLQNHRLPDHLEDWVNRPASPFNP